ncbi:MAG: GumC family protein [Ignavibacteriales bacterium]
MSPKRKKPVNLLSEASLSGMMDNDSASLKDYLILFRMHYFSILVIALVALAVSLVYALKSPDIYKSTTMLKISKPKGNILEAPFIPELSESKSTFVLNEIEILKSYTIREKVALAVIDSLREKGGDFRLIYDDEVFGTRKKVLLPIYRLVKMLAEKVNIEQKRDLEIINISAESPSPYEAMMIAKCYGDVYHEMNLTFNRLLMINVRKFLEKQSDDKHKKLLEAENSLKGYQEVGGIVELDEQAKALIGQLTDFEAKRNAAKIELSMVEKTLADYKAELAKQEPRLVDYLEKLSIEPYLQGLQLEIAKYEVKRDVALGKGETRENNDQLRIYNDKIAELKEKRDNKLQVFKTGMMASSSEDIKQLLQKVLETEVKYHALSASYKELNGIVAEYEGKFNSLPKRTIDLARLEREKGETEKLYLLIQEKFQEAMINEQSTPGNVLIIDPARLPLEPFKPNRKMIVLVGVVLGLVMGAGFVLVRNYMDNTIQTPEDIQNMNINLLGWVPSIDYLQNSNGREFEFIVAKKPDSIPSEAYRALRTRILFAKVGRDAIKTILITSGSPREGKTVTAVNIAGSFAQSGRKTVLMDCDLRKPRIAKIFNQQKSPGFTDYIFENASYDEIIRPTELKDMYYIASGTIPPNPSEILGSHEMSVFLQKLRADFDMIVLDSPPVLAVTDAEILSRAADGTILVSSAGVTEIDVMKKSVELLEHNDGTFIGVLLNNFVYREGYGSYYKYSYYYSGSSQSPREKSGDKPKDKPHEKSKEVS